METQNPTAAPSPWRGPSQGQEAPQSVWGAGVLSPRCTQAVPPLGLAGSWGAVLPLCQLPAPARALLSLRDTGPQHGTQGLRLVFSKGWAVPGWGSSCDGGAAAWLTPVTHPKDTQPLGSTCLPLCTCTPKQCGDSRRRAKLCCGVAPTQLVPGDGAPLGHLLWGARPCPLAPTPAPPSCAQLPPTQPPALLWLWQAPGLPDPGPGCRVQGCRVWIAACGVQGAG